MAGEVHISLYLSVADIGIVNSSCGIHHSHTTPMNFNYSRMEVPEN
jgi:hypothetical protein